MRVVALEPIKTKTRLVSTGDIIDVSEKAAQKLGAKVLPLNDRIKASSSPSGDRNDIRIENGELKILHPVENMAAEIIKLTGSDLAEQRRLLLLHCESYDQHHFFELALKWESRVTTLESTVPTVPTVLAEIQAAMELNLLAFFDKLRDYDDEEVEKYEGDAS